MPAVGVVAAAPSYAASRLQPEIGGALSMVRTSTSTSCTLNMGGNGESIVDSQGHWIKNAKATTKVGPMTVTLWIPSSWATATITRMANGDTRWSMLTRVSSTTVRPAGVPSDYVGFSTTYSGVWPTPQGSTAGYKLSGTTLLATARPAFTLTRTGSCLNVSSYITRSVSIDGKQQTITRERLNW